MEKESFGIIFKAMTGEFKSQLRNLVNDIRNFGKEAEENTEIKPYIVDTGYEKQIAYVKNQMEDIQETLRQISLGAEEGDPYKLEAKYENLSYKLRDLVKLQDEYNNELEETGKTSKEINLEGMFDKSISKIKRFTFYLLGARSAFSLFRKYQNIYYQYNEQMQYQSELSQNAIALSLAPAFEVLGNVIAYASIAFAKFIELLTGVNVLSKVSTKGIRDYNKGLKESQQLLSGIDEITNINLPGGTGTGLASQYQALDDFQKKIAEVEKFFKENEWIGAIADGLKKVWEKLQIVFDYVKEHWDVFKYIFGAVAIGGLLGGGNLGFAIAITGLTSFIQLVDALNDYNKAKKEFDENHKKTHDLIFNNFKDMTEFLLNDTKDALKGVQKGTKTWNDRIDDVKSQLPSILNEIRNGELAYEEYKPTIDTWIKELQNLDGEKFKPEIEFLTKLNGSEQDLDLIRDYYATGSPNVSRAFGGGGTGTFGGRGSFGGRELDYNVNLNADDAKNNIQRIVDKLKELTGKKHKISFTTEILSTVAKGATSGALALSQAITKSIRGYAKGLDYVPYDNYPALLHKGESVVPAKYNPTIHSAGNEYTNSLLETLVMKMDELAKRPNVFEIDGQKFANATYGLYNDANTRQGYVEGVVR